MNKSELGGETRPSAAQRKSGITLSRKKSITSMTEASTTLEVKQQVPPEKPAQNVTTAELEIVSSPSTMMEGRQLPEEPPFQKDREAELGAVSAPSTILEARQLSEEPPFQNDREAELGAVSAPSTMLETRQLPQGNSSQSTTDASLDTTFLLSPEAIKVFVVAVAVLTFIVPIINAVESLVLEFMYLLRTQFYFIWTLGLFPLALTLIFSRTISSLVILYWLKYMSSLGDTCLVASWTRLGGLFHRLGRPNLLEGCDRTFWTCVGVLNLIHKAAADL